VSEREVIETLIYATFRKYGVEPLSDPRYPLLIAALGKLCVEHRSAKA
jgi:hypothetical protein